MKLHSFELKTTGKYQVLCLQTGVWTGVCVSGQGCACLDRGVPVWTGVCVSGQGCACLDRGVRVWTGVCLSGQECACQDRGVRVWTGVCLSWRNGTGSQPWFLTRI